MRNTLGSLFSGGGGWDAGALLAGIDPVFAVEMETWIARWYAHVFGEHVVNASVADVDYDRLQRVRFIVSSPPCQATSRSGKAGATRRAQRGLPPRSSAAASGMVCDPTVGLATLKAVDGVDPEVVLVENNADYQKSATFRAIVNGLESRGFNVDYAVLRAEHYGVASGRERLILRASRRRLPPWPKEVRRPSWYDIIADIVDEMPVERLAPWQAKGLRDNPPPTNTPVLIAGGNPSRNARGYVVHRTPSQPAWTTQLATNTSGMRFRDEFGVVRRMSTRAIARLQGFPDNYPMPKSRVQAIHILGNSVPPILAEQLLRGFL